MANIIFTNYCNLHCEYCFANKIKSQSMQNITEKQLQRILDWLKKDYRESHRIGIIGGEPTLHPYFIDRINQLSIFLEETKSEAMLFTNGLNIMSYLKYLNKKIGMLINVNKEKIDILDSQLNYLFNHKNYICGFTLGCNLYPNEKNYDFFWNIIKKYNVHNIRVSITTPQQKKYIENKDLYFSIMTPIFEDFVNNVYKYNCELQKDCSWIPSCYLQNTTIQQKDIVDKICLPTIDITPDFKATSCFGLSDFIDCSLFKTPTELFYYFLFKQVAPYTESNYQEKCEFCDKKKYLECSGGCLNLREKKEYKL